MKKEDKLFVRWLVLYCLVIVAVVLFTVWFWGSLRFLPDSLQGIVALSGLFGIIVAYGIGDYYLVEKPRN